MLINRKLAISEKQVYSERHIRRKYLKKNDTENMIYGGIVKSSMYVLSVLEMEKNMARKKLSNIKSENK